MSDAMIRSVILNFASEDASSRSYEIVIGPGVIGGLGGRAAGLVPGRRSLLVVDDNLPPSLVEHAESSLGSAGFSVARVSVHASEQDKSLRSVERVLRAADESGLGRADLFVALGGGIVGDIAGFAAASYMRGVSVIQCPTTLLAMVDASVGGKTGVNLASADVVGMRKNLVGAFWQPRLVLADLRSLDSLAAREFHAGLAECVKHTLLCGGIDSKLGDWTTERLRGVVEKDDVFLGELVERNVGIKTAFVAGDERETAGSERVLLNLGHTFAHAMEPLPGLSPTSDPALAPLLHGEAVALGLVAAADASVGLGLLTDAERGALVETLDRMSLPTTVAGLTPNEQLIDAMRHDKKSEGGGLRLVLPCTGGTCRVVRDPDLRVVEDAWDSIRASR